VLRTEAAVHVPERIMRQSASRIALDSSRARSDCTRIVRVQSSSYNGNTHAH
jgi:hypothetical protein